MAEQQNSRCVVQRSRALTTIEETLKSSDMTEAHKITGRQLAQLTASAPRRWTSRIALVGSVDESMLCTNSCPTAPTRGACASNTHNQVSVKFLPYTHTQSLCQQYAQSGPKTLECARSRFLLALPVLQRVHRRASPQRCLCASESGWVCATCSAPCSAAAGSTQGSGLAA